MTPIHCLTCLSNSGEHRISPGPPIYEGVGWIVEHAYPTALLGWTVIVLRRHAEALHELTLEEFVELGQLQRAVSLALRAETGCEKEYSICYAEVEGFKHIHFHMIPRAGDLTAERQGGGVFAYLKPDTEALEPDIVAECCERLRELVDRHMNGLEIAGTTR